MECPARLLEEMVPRMACPRHPDRQTKPLEQGQPPSMGPPQCQLQLKAGCVRSSMERICSQVCLPAREAPKAAMMEADSLPYLHQRHLPDRLSTRVGSVGCVLTVAVSEMAGADKELRPDGWCFNGSAWPLAGGGTIDVFADEGVSCAWLMHRLREGREDTAMEGKGAGDVLATASSRLVFSVELLSKAAMASARASAAMASIGSISTSVLEAGLVGIPWATLGFTGSERRRPGFLLSLLAGDDAESALVAAFALGSERAGVEAAASDSMAAKGGAVCYHFTDSASAERT